MKIIIFTILTLISVNTLAGNTIINRRTGELLKLERGDWERREFMEITYVDRKGNSEVLKTNYSDQDFLDDFYDIKPGSFGFPYQFTNMAIYEVNPIVSFTVFSFITVPIAIIETVGALEIKIKKSRDYTLKRKAKADLLMLHHRQADYKVSNRRFKFIKSFFLK